MERVKKLELSIGFYFRINQSLVKQRKQGIVNGNFIWIKLLYIFMQAQIYQNLFSKKTKYFLKILILLL